MKKKKILLLLISLIICFSCNVKSADSIIINAKIYTVNNQNEIAKSIAIKDGKILDISNSNLNKEYYSNTIIDAKGKTILPGLIDSHCHFYNLGLNQQVVNLRGTKSLNEILEKLIDYDNENNAKIIVGYVSNDTKYSIDPNIYNMLVACVTFDFNTQSLTLNTPTIVEDIDGSTSHGNSWIKFRYCMLPNNACKCHFFEAKP